MSEYKLQAINIEMTLKDSTVLTIGNSDIILGSLSIEEASSTVDEFRIGTAISKKLKFTLNNFEDTFSAYDFVNATVALRMQYNVIETPALTGTVSITNGILEDSGATLDGSGILTFGKATKNATDIVELQAKTLDIPFGVFYVTEKPVYNGSVIAFTALDCLYKTAKQYETALTYPASIGSIYREICAECGLTPQTPVIPNEGYVVTEKPDFSAVTFADMLCWVAEISGGFVFTDADGLVGIKQYGDIVHNIGSSYTSEMDTDDITITGVGVVECFDETDARTPGYYLSGSAGYILPISGNPLIQYGDAQTVADYLAGIYVGMQFRPLRLTIPQDPTIHVGDAIIYTDRKSNSYGAYVTEMQYQTDDVTTVAMGAKSPAENASTKYSEGDRASANVRRLTSADALFDKIYARGINCDYLVTGIIKSAVSGFSLNMDTGEAELSNVVITGGRLFVEEVDDSAYAVRVSGVWFQPSTAPWVHEHDYVAGLTRRSLYITEESCLYDSNNAKPDYPTGKTEVTINTNQFSMAEYTGDGTSSPTTPGRSLNADFTGFHFHDGNYPRVWVGSPGLGGYGLYAYDGSHAPNEHSASLAYQSGTGGVLELYDNTRTNSASLNYSNLTQMVNHLGVGVVTSATLGSSSSLTTATWKTLTNISHGTGNYLILAHVSYASNTSGMRWIMVTASTSSSTVIADGCADLRAPVNGSATHAKIAMVVNATSSGTWYLRAYQNSGGNLNATSAWIQLIKMA